MVSSSQISWLILYAVFIYLPPPWPICMLSPSNHTGEHLFLTDCDHYFSIHISRCLPYLEAVFYIRDMTLQCSALVLMTFFLKEMRKATYLYSWVGWAKSPQWWMLQNVTHSRPKAGLFSLSTAPCHWQIKIRWDPGRLSGLCDLQGSTAPLLCLSVTSTQSVFMSGSVFEFIINFHSYYLLLISLQMSDSKCEQ